MEDLDRNVQCLTSILSRVEMNVIWKASVGLRKRQAFTMICYHLLNWGPTFSWQHHDALDDSTYY